MKKNFGFKKLTSVCFFFHLKIKLNEKKATIKELAVSKNATNASNSTNRIMVNVPLAPKKYNTFNENDRQSTATSNPNFGGNNGLSNGHSEEKDNQEIFDNFAKQHVAVIAVLKSVSLILFARFK